MWGHPGAEPGRIWPVGALVRAVGEALAARFNPVEVRGELSGVVRAGSGHCYFSLKDGDGQIRCAMFRRVAQGLDFAPKDGDRVEVTGRLDVYSPRGDLQLIVEGMRQTGQGSLFEQFLKLKAQLQSQGLFDAERKRPLPTMPRSVGVVTSRNAAALHDVLTALMRRLPHTSVLVFPASVQGAQAPAELCAALDAAAQQFAQTGQPEVLLLVRGGGSLEDLWAFNTEAVAHAVARAPMPVVAGVGHETDFTIADFVADLRAPTPTAAAELCATDRRTWQTLWQRQASELQESVQGRLDTLAQGLDRLGSRLSRPSARVTAQRQMLLQLEHKLQQTGYINLQRRIHTYQAISANFDKKIEASLAQRQRRLQRSADALALLDPKLVLQRGYAWLQDEAGHTLTQVAQVHEAQHVRATLADGVVDLTVR